MVLALTGVANAGEQTYSCIAPGMTKPVEMRIINDEVLIYDNSGPIPITPPVNGTKSSPWRMLQGRADVGAWHYGTEQLTFNGSPPFTMSCRGVS